MSYELREHTADVAVEATADSLGAVFAAVADGMAAAMTAETPDAGSRFTFEERAESREALLFDYLDRLIYERDVRNVLPVDHDAAVREADGEWVVEGSARGVPLNEVHARDLKAVTYSEMDLSEREADGGWHAYVVFDV
ncbi:homolog to archaease [Halobacterium hubeiense]|uniref:Homolog to archaease n=1 Tax=Halobacterium hubeiense TaxID=1407499 RepID=A0A0U5H7W2_9EURY|nr:archease [Halobacterium hubeiense]CQH58779.1 homolog to archaease [Halobacterium hubeiense]